MQYGGIILGFLSSLAVSLLAIPSIVTVARNKNLYDKPQGRRPGRKKVPTLGGLAIFAGTIISLALFADASQFPELPYVIAGSVILFFIGIKDDILIIAPWWKLSGQILAGMIIAIMAGLQISTIDIFPGIGRHGDVVDILLSVLVIIIIINSFNLIDGIDGLASGIGIFSSLVLGCLFIHSGLLQYAILSFILCGSLLGFFYYNVFSRHNKILMGDTGSMMLGFMLSILVIRLINLDGPSFFGIKIQTPLSLALAILIVPLFDMIRVILTRIKLGRSPFKPDRLHIHYRLIDMGFNHLQSTGILLTVQVLMIIILLVLQDIGELYLTLLILSVSTLLYLIQWLLQRRGEK